ncbi:DUF6959 family protein [Streptomyces sp. NBC_01014]
MEHVEAELFTDGGNNAVVRLPPRRFPGDSNVEGPTAQAFLNQCAARHWL